MELEVVWYVGPGLGIYIGYLFCFTNDGREVSPKSPLLVVAWPIVLVVAMINLIKQREDT